MTKKPKLATINVLFKGIPRNLWSHYKAWCALRGINAKAKFLSFLKETVQERMKP